MRKNLILKTISLALVLAAAAATRSYAGSAYQPSDVFAAVGSGQVYEFSPTGTLIQTLDDGSGSAYTTGMAFDSAGNLYVTNFATGTVSQLNNTGGIVNTNFITGQSNPESLVYTSSGSIFVGDAGRNTISQYNASGALTNTFTVQTQNRGTDWIDFQNANTIVYTSEGNTIFSYNISTDTQNAPITTALAGGTAYALRVIPTGSTDAGDILVADSSYAALVDPTTGAILQTYTLPGNGGGDFSLNIDPNGKDFWTGDFSSGNIWEVNIATGAIDMQFNSGSSALYGITIFGEKTTTSATPEPATLSLLGLGLAGIGSKLRRKKS